MEVLHNDFDRGSFRPNTDATLLRHIVVVMRPTTGFSTDTDLITPSTTLDAAQVIFLRHPQTMTWCWKLWNDPRIAHAETIDQLTATWLYHVGEPFEEDGTSRVAFGNTDVLTALEANPATACVALTRFINRSISVISAGSKHLPPAVLGVIYEAVSACATYLLTEGENGGSLITELCASFGQLFLHLRQGPVTTITKDVILEGLSAVRTDTLRTAMEKLLGCQSELKLKLEDSKFLKLSRENDFQFHPLSY
ncbi:uncharacterized protein B0H18DRAFT_201818 [Fomitopsis serialis]|uniref:uncharacterized protein n=1 Tax=Fomitopsis serialis TaxID=139415 RepID=UPI0020088CE7|nr:uncharacterized protein B0H18DRAFT_201818 [Neoantrodia serialis]KAH9937561.1 hypothetical protein B0H18DRAFT_201818 [Neoantrodia serialis]